MQQGHIMCERSVLLRTLNHPFLVRLHYCFQTSDKLYFVLDYASGGEVGITVTLNTSKLSKLTYYLGIQGLNPKEWITNT